MNKNKKQEKEIPEDILIKLEKDLIITEFRQTDTGITNSDYQKNKIIEMGYTGNLEDFDKVINFIFNNTIQKIKEQELEIEKLKSFNSYEKQLTTPNLSKSKTYYSKYKKPNRMASEEVIQGVLAVNGKIFYEHNTNLNDKTYKLLDCALAKLTSQTTYKGNNSQDRFDVKINIKEYLTSIGKEPTPTAIKYIKEQIKTRYANALQSLRLIIKSQDKKGTSWASTQIPFIETVGYDPENIHIVFGFDFATLLTTKGLIKYHARCLYEIDNPNAYTLGSKLEEYYGMYSNRKRKQNNKLSIKILLEYCPAIPTEEKVRNSNGARNYPARIIEPFQTALQKLYKIGFVTSWKYVSNSPLKEEKQAQLDNKNITDFKLFKKLYIVYELSNFPSELEAIKIEGNNTKICTI